MPDIENESAEARLRETLHDLSGPMVTARGFTAELRYARESALALLDSLPPETDPAIRHGLKEQIDTEMDLCLFHVEESLAKLDATIDGLRPA